MNIKRQLIKGLAVAAALGALALPWTARADDKPTLHLLVGFPPGGSVDVVARIVAERLKSVLDQTVIVDNRPGASGRLALGELKRASPDAQTLVLSPSGALVILPWLYKNLGYDPAKDFTPVARVATFDLAVAAGPGAPAGDIKTVMAWFKANPTKAYYGTSGAGTVPHFAGQLLAQATGIPLTHIPYKGGAPAVQDLMGGQIPLMVDTASETIEYHRNGKLRILAVTGDTRSPALPNVPTLRESGIDVVADAFFGLYGPPNMPADRVSKVSEAVAQVLKIPEVQSKIRDLGLNANYAGPQDLAAMQAAHLKRWEKPIKLSGYTVE